MIALDSSALLAIALDEEAADICMARIDVERHLVLSSATYAETLIVSMQRNVGPIMTELLEALACEIAPVDESTARRVADAYARWGKGKHAVKLNFGDCFAYALARVTGEPLLYKGDDFAHMDVASALAAR